MATAAQIALLQNNPSVFLKNYGLIWRGVAPTAQGPIYVYLEDAGTIRARTGAKFLGMGNKKAVVPSFEVRWRNAPLRPMAPGTASFQVEWSGYVAGGTSVAALANAGGPNLMMTPELTGCAVALSKSPDGSARFSHYNLKKPGEVNETLDAADMRAQAALDYAGTSHIVSTKEDYRGTAKHLGMNVNVTVVGFRDNGVWEFWRQTREDKATGLQLRIVDLM